MTRLYLADKSAYGQRQHNADARAIFDAFTENGTLATCEMIALEILYSARNLADYERTRAGLESLPWLETSNKALRRAIDIQHALARRGQHRTSLPDIVIAATAEEHGVVVLHFDSDFDRIAAITGQEMLWIVPRPSRPIPPSRETPQCTRITDDAASYWKLHFLWIDRIHAYHRARSPRMGAQSFQHQRATDRDGCRSAGLTNDAICDSCNNAWLGHGIEGRAARLLTPMAVDRQSVVLDVEAQSTALPAADGSSVVGHLTTFALGYVAFQVFSVNFLAADRHRATLWNTRVPSSLTQHLVRIWPQEPITPDVAWPPRQFANDEWRHMDDHSRFGGATGENSAGQRLLALSRPICL